MMLGFVDSLTNALIPNYLCDTVWNLMTVFRPILSNCLLSKYIVENKCQTYLISIGLVAAPCDKKKISKTSIPR